MWNGDKRFKALRELIDDAPKTLSKEYLQVLHFALCNQELEPDTNLEAIINSLLLIIIDKDACVSSRYFSIVILQKLSPIKNVSDLLAKIVGPHVVNALPFLLSQDITGSDVTYVIKQLFWSLCHSAWPEDVHCQLLPFFNKVFNSPQSPLLQDADDVKKLSSLLPGWLIIPASKTIVKSPGFRRSTSSLSITEIDGTDMQDFFTVLNYAPVINAQQFRSIHTFSVLRALCNSGENKKQTHLNGFVTEELAFSIREYCMRLIDQVDRSKTQPPDIVEFQKACLIEAIELFNCLCLRDSGIVHSIFPVIRRIHDRAYSDVLKKPKIEDVEVLLSSIQFYMNHGSSVMHKPDSLYVFIFCDMLNACYKDNTITFEILHLMKQNLSQLCYHSSILEKYFPTFFKVLAWRPNTYINDFLDLLPAFLSQYSSVEVFHTLIDLPCLTAVLMLMDNETKNLDPKIMKDPVLLEVLKKDEIKYISRKMSGDVAGLESLKQLHQNLISLASHYRVTCCAEVVVPLLRLFFDVFLQYADVSVSVLLIPAVLERLSLLYPVPNYSKAIHNILASSVLQLFELHPETVFHCQKNIISFISNYKNYFVAEQIFIHMVWVVGEYVSNVYSSICRPEIIAVFFESLESTTYESLSSLQESSDDQFLKFMSVSVTALSKLAARSQDQIPRAVLCLSKVHKQLSSFGNDHKKNWKIVIERVMELLCILNSPNVAAVVLSPPKNLENGRLHCDSTTLPYVLRTLSSIVTVDS